VASSSDACSGAFSSASAPHHSHRGLGDGGEARVAAQGAKAVADVSAQLIDEPEAEGFAVRFVPGGEPAEIDMGLATGFFFGEALAD
jgi:hypothetical protein